MATRLRPRVIIIGAGFGGLFAARTLANKPVDVLLIDRQNFHTFTPLLYQVATSALDPSEIAYPIRSIFRRNANVLPMLGEVTDVNYADRKVVVKTREGIRHETYDYLILAAGSVPAYFGNSAIREHAFELRTLSDAVIIRNHVLKLFERAAWTDDAERRVAMTTLVVVGGGPTGLETAGALHELYNHVLNREYAHNPDLMARVILVEAKPYVLEAYPDRLRESALKQLRSLGVEVILNSAVAEVAADHMRLEDGTLIPTYTVIWSAGVQASPAVEFVDAKLAHAERIRIRPTTEVEGRDNIYAVGDNAYLDDPDSVPYPMLIPVAMQQGILAAHNILRRIAGKSQETFHYADRGIMATIGRSRAVAYLFNRLQLSGFVAWLAWLGFHLLTLLGFRNKLNVLVNWVWNYFTYDRSVRIILEHITRDED